MNTCEQKYKEALERARIWQNHLYDTNDRDYADELNYIFPELAESKDEKIKKMLRAYIHDFGVPKEYFGDVETSDVLVWLQKQKPIDEEELKKGALKYVARQFMKWLDVSIPKDEMCLSNAECKVIEDAFLKDDWATISHYMCEKLKRQGEQIELKKVKQDNHPRIVMADFNGGEGFFKLNLDNLNKEQVDTIEMMINNPKQGEQTQLDYEHADIPKKDFAPVGTKFKVGEWIIHQGTENIYQVTGCIDKQYQLKYGDNYTIQKCADVDRCARLWTIKDAKDGDVLMTTKTRNCPFIYRKTDYNNNLAYYYAGIDGNGDFWEGCIKRKLYHFGPVSNVVPATKEQRDLLFSKMKEAGYIWDADKKELKKIEHKTLNADEVIEWLKPFCVIVDNIIDKFKKDFELC